MEKIVLHKAQDARQTPEWGEYLRGIGWTIAQAKHVLLFIKKVPIFPFAIIKIQHPVGPFPFSDIDHIAKKYHALFTLIEPHEYEYNAASLKKHGYIISKLRAAHSATIKIDITQNEEKLFTSFSENARRNIKKAQKNNLAIQSVYLEKEKDDTKFQLFYQLLKELTTMKKFYVPSYDEYYKKMQAFKKNSLLLFAYDGDTPIAVVWYAWYDQTISYFQTGITQKGYDLLANYLLVWEGIKVAQKKGLEIFDFETVYDERYPDENKKWKGYSEFKKRFHGEMIYYPPSWIKFYNKPFFCVYFLATFLQKV